MIRPRSGLDLHRHRHARRKIDELVLDLHLSSIKRYARRVDEFLSLRLAACLLYPR